MSTITHKLYNEETLKVMIPQGSSPQFKGHFSKDMYDEWLKDSSVLVPGCGCTSFTIDREAEQITFTVNAPIYMDGIPMQTKAVTPKFKSKLTNLYVEWHIKFYVNPKK